MGLSFYGARQRTGTNILKKKKKSKNPGKTRKKRRRSEGEAIKGFQINRDFSEEHLGQKRKKLVI